MVRKGVSGRAGTAASWPAVLVCVMIAFPSLMVVQVSAPAGAEAPGTGWWNLEWRNRRPVDVVNGGNGTLHGHQVTFKVPASEGMNANMSDLRFVQTVGGTDLPLPYWIEEEASGWPARVWVNVSELAPGTTRLYMYYNNSNARALSSGPATFGFFDDFTTDTTGRFNLSKYVYPAGNHHSYYYYDRNYPGEDTLNIPGRLVWRMKMTSYQVSNWGTAHWWAMRNQTGNTAINDDPDYLEIGIYANSDVKADSSHPSMSLSVIRDGVSNSSERSLVRIAKNEYYTYSIAVAGNSTEARVVSRTDEVLWSPSVPSSPRRTRFLHFGDFVGIHGEFGGSHLNWDHKTNLIAYSDTEHVNSHMEFNVDHIFLTKYALPEPSVTVGAAELGPMNSTALFDRMTVEPGRPNVGEPADIGIFLKNRGGLDASANVTVRVGRKGTDPGSAAQVASFNVTLVPGGESRVNRTWTPAEGGNWTVWCLIDGNKAGSLDVYVNGAPAITAVGDQNAFVGEPFMLALRGSDPDGDYLEWTVNTSALAMLVKDNRTATLSFMPAEAHVGVMNVSVKACDGNGLEARVAFRITVYRTSQNHPPGNVVISSPAAGAKLAAGKEVAFRGSAVDPDGDALVYTWYVDGVAIGQGQEMSRVLENGSRAVRLVVSDTRSSAEATVTVKVGGGGGNGEVTVIDKWYLAIIAAIVMMAVVAFVLLVNRRGREPEQGM